MTVINSTNALGAKVLKHLPFNGTEGEIVSGAAVALSAAGSYVNDATNGWQLHGNGSAAAATVPFDLTSAAMVTMRFFAKFSAPTNALLLGTDSWDGTGGGYVVIADGTNLTVAVSGNGRGLVRTYPLPSLNVRHAYEIVLGTNGTENSITVRVDGAALAQASATPFSTGFASNTKMTAKPVHLLGGPGFNAVSGYIEDFSVFSGPLTDDERATLASNPNQIFLTEAAPGAPTNLLAEPSDGVALVSFDAPTGANPAILDYTVTSSPGGFTATETESPIVVTGLQNGIQYTFTAKARNSVGSSPASLPSNAVTPFVDSTTPFFVSAAMNTAGTEITLTFSEPLAQAALPLSALTGFNRTFGGLVFSGNTLKLTGISPVIQSSDVVSFSYVKPDTNFLGDAASNAVPNFSTGTIPNTVPYRPTLPGHVVKVFGDSSFADFTTAEQVAAYITGTDYVALGSKVMVYAEKQLDLRNRNLTPSSLSDDYYPILRPIPGQSFDELEAANAPGAIGTLGIDVLMDNTGIGNGVRIEKLRVRASGSSDVVKFAFNGLQHGTEKSEGGFYGCRILQTGSGRIFEGEYGFFPTYLKDCLVVVNGNNTAPIIHSKGRFGTERNTFVRLNGAVGYTAIACDYGSRGDHENIFKGCGGQPITVLDQGSNAENNYTDTPVTGYSGSKMIYVAGPFFESATDYRPAAGSALIGKGTSRSVSTIDNNGNNRGPLGSADPGAFQRTPSVPLATGYVTTQHPIDGQTLKIEMAIAGNPDSGSMSLLPASPPNGAQSVGPIPFVFNANKTTATVETDDIQSGDYVVSLLLQNGGGFSTVTGATPVSVMGMGGLVYDTGLSGTGVSEPDPVIPLPAPTVSIAVTLSGKTASISGSFNAQGDANAQISLFADPQPSGTPIPIAPTVTGSAYAKQVDMAAGLFIYRARIVANGQTVEAVTASKRVLDLVGSFNLPA